MRISAVITHNTRPLFDHSQLTGIFASDLIICQRSNPNNTGLPAQWSLPGGADVGRLHINRYSGATIAATRGWQVVKQVVNRQWLMKNMALIGLTESADIVPTNRVLAYDRQ